MHQNLCIACKYIIVRIKEFSKDRSDDQRKLEEACNFADKKYEGLLGYIWEGENKWSEVEK